MDIQSSPSQKETTQPAKNRRGFLWLAIFPFFAAMGIGAWFPSPIFLVAQVILLIVAGFIMALGVLERERARVFPRAAESNFEEYRLVIERLEDAVMMYDSDFRITFWNPAAERLFNIAPPEAMGHILTPQDVESPRWRLLAQVAFPSLAPGMVTRSPAGIYPQVADLSFNNPFLELRITTLSLGAAPGEAPAGFVKVIRDRTRESSLMKAKSEFVAIASHQLRTPTTGIHWALEALHKDEHLDSNTKTLVDGAFAGSELLLKIIDDLLGIAKIEEGRFGYAFANMNLIEFLDSLLTRIIPEAQRAGVSIYFDKSAGKIPPVVADSQKLAMAISNIIENAIRYNVKNGTVTVGVAKVTREPFVEVTVKDTGIGMEPEDIKKLFTKFFRAGNAAKLQTEGSGLGLYIVKNIIQAHGGRIWAESELERGTTFHFTLATDPNRVPRHEVPLG